MARSRFTARAVLLDWDGTLLDSYHADARAYLAMFRELEIPWGLKDLARHYSPDWYHVYRAARLPRSRWELADRLWRRAYAQEKPKLLPGARGVLHVLKSRFKLGLVTSGSRARVRKQLREFEFAKLFSACVCCEDAIKRKPHPAPLQLALGRLRLQPRDCLYVGDSAEDIEMARRAGVRSIAILGPFPTHDRVRAASPNLLLESIRELPSWIDVSP
ncbi:MAG: HAD family hydrolase [Candidatus Acidiferrales bacterium]